MLAYFLFLISKEDIRTRLIPDELSLCIAILALGNGGFGFFRLNLALFVLLLSSLFMGLGDAKLLGALSLIFGPKIFTIIILSFFCAALYILPQLITKKLSLKDTIPFAPFISIATVAVMLMKHLI